MLPQYVLKINEYMTKYNVSYNKARYLIMYSLIFRTYCGNIIIYLGKNLNFIFFNF